MTREELLEEKSKYERLANNVFYAHRDIAEEELKKIEKSILYRGHNACRQEIIKRIEVKEGGLR
jgi:hypothetical protein